MLHLIYIPFRGVGIDLRDNTWFKERIDIFKKYTLQSLIKQSNQNFVVWMSFRPQDEYNPLIQEIVSALREANLRWIFSFHGLMYHDDKFTDEWWPKIKNYGRIIRYCWRMKSIKDFIPHVREMAYNKNHSLRLRLKESLLDFQKYFEDVEWVYLSRIDSDDMFHNDYVDIIQQLSPQKAVVLCRNGLIYNDSTGELAEWNPPTNPPFHTIMFPAVIFFDAAKHVAYYNGYKSHEDAPKISLNRVAMPDGMYCVLTHNPKNHISTIWNHPFRGKMVEKELLNDFI